MNIIRVLLFFPHEITSLHGYPKLYLTQPISSEVRLYYIPNILTRRNDATISRQRATIKNDTKIDDYLQKKSNPTDKVGKSD